MIGQNKTSTHVPSATIFLCFSGKDNYLGRVHDTAFNLTVIEQRGDKMKAPPKNVAFYHRY